MYAAVKGCTISILPPIVSVEGVTSIQIQTPPSNKVKIDGNGIYSGSINVIITGATLNGLQQVSPAIITINPQIVKNAKVEKKLVLTDGDNGQSSTPVTFNAGPATASAIMQIQITNAGQSKVKVK